MKCNINKFKEFLQFNNKFNKDKKQIKNGKGIDSSPKKIYIWSIAPEKLLNIMSHKGNADQNHNEILLHAHQDGQN